MPHLDLDVSPNLSLTKVHLIIVRNNSRLQLTTHELSTCSDYTDLLREAKASITKLSSAHKNPTSDPKPSSDPRNMAPQALQDLAVAASQLGQDKDKDKASSGDASERDPAQPEMMSTAPQSPSFSLAALTSAGLQPVTDLQSWEDAKTDVGAAVWCSGEIRVIASLL